MSTERKALVWMMAAVVFAVAAANAAADWGFGTPVNLGALVNSSAGEGSPEVSADGLELYFNSTRPGYGGTDIWVARRLTQDAEWGKAENLGPVVNTAANETAPTISSDGLELYFCDFQSPRPGGSGNSDIWVTRRATKGAPWGPPVNLGPLVNSPSNEITPEVSFDGLELYFECDRPGGLGSDDLWVARRATRKETWGRALWLGAVINTPAMEHCPNITSDGLTLFFDLTPPGGSVGELMVTNRATLDEDWGKPVNLGHVQSDHWASSVTAGGTFMYYASARPGGSGGNDVWRIPLIYTAPAP